VQGDGRPTKLQSNDNSRYTNASRSTSDDAENKDNNDNSKSLEEPLLRNWGDKTVILNTPRLRSKSPKQQLLATQEKEHEQLGDLLRGWVEGNERPRVSFRNESNIGGLSNHAARPSFPRSSLSQYYTNRGTLNTTRVSFSAAEQTASNRTSQISNNNRTSGGSLSLIDALRASELRSSTGNSLIEIDNDQTQSLSQPPRQQEPPQGKDADIKKSKSDSKLFTPAKHSNKLQSNHVGGNFTANLIDKGKRLERIVSDETQHHNTPGSPTKGNRTSTEGSIYISTENLKSIYMSGENGVGKVSERPK